MSTSGFRIALCAFAVMVMTHAGCQDSSTTTVDNTPAPAETAVESVAAQPANSDATAAVEPVDSASADAADPDATTPADPMPEELATVTPADPSTVPATPEPETPEEPEPPTPLGIGDAAPPLAIAEWVTGEAIEQLATGQVYVVEFWATWCPPCRTSMPHLSQLQEQYADDVHFVGITREDGETVRGFLDQEQSEGKTWNEVVKYRLALDADDQMSQTYMRAAGQNGIPTAFIVGADGVVEWIGHPMTMDEPLAKIVAGEWDRAAAIAAFEQEKRSDELLAGLNQHVRASDWDSALALIDDFETSYGKSASVTGYRVSILAMAGRDEEAAAAQGQLVDASWDDAQMLNQIAWNIAIGRGAGDMALAKRAAERASELTDNGDASILDTVARVHYELGDLQKAIEWQKKAVELDAANPQISAALERYENELKEKAEKADAPAESPAETTPEESESPGESP